MKKHSAFNWIWLIRENFNGHFTSTIVLGTAQLLQLKQIFISFLMRRIKITREGSLKS